MVIIPLNLVQLSAEDRREHQLNFLAHRECHLFISVVDDIEPEHYSADLHFHSWGAATGDHCD